MGGSANWTAPLKTLVALRGACCCLFAGQPQMQRSQIQQIRKDWKVYRIAKVSYKQSLSKLGMRKKAPPVTVNAIRRIEKVRFTIGFGIVELAARCCDE